MSNKLCQIASSVVLLLLSVASVRAAERQTLPTRVPAAARLQKLAPLPATDRLQLAIGLPLRDQDKLRSLLQQIYDPADPNFRHYLTPAQFTERFGPTEQEYKKVKDYAKANGMDIVYEYGNRGLVDVAGRVADIEKMFHVKLGRYQHPTEDRRFYAPDVEPTVEAGMPINYVVGLDDFVIPRPMLSTNVAALHQKHPQDRQGSGSNGWYIGSDFRYAYARGVPLTGAGQIAAVFEQDGFESNDIVKYEALAGYSNVPLQTVLLPGASGEPGMNNNFNMEIDLDIEMVIAMAPGLEKLLVVECYYTEDGMNQLAYPSNGVPLANQISISSYATYDTNWVPQLMEMAAQGQSCVMASGDMGAPTNGLCESGSTYIGDSGWPGDYNYATMVGGTELYMNDTGTSWAKETVWDNQYILGESTGYVDPGLPIPEYQTLVNTTANGGSSTYRNVPDVAACADDIELVYTSYTSNKFTSGNVTVVGGTSASAPLWGGFLALVNEQAANQGLPPVGFLNPVLYSIAAGPLYTNCFHDITNGNNTNAWSANLYTAGPGYDNCTGLGSPNGQAMIDALVGYAGPIWVNFSGPCPGNGTDTNPFCALASATNAVANGGTICLVGPNSSSVTPTITKAMTLRAFYGPVTIGKH
jgi:subtilase family serine protease